MKASWTVVAFSCFTVVKSFTSWYTLLLLFFLRFSSVSLHCSHAHFSFALFMHLGGTTKSVLFKSVTKGGNKRGSVTDPIDGNGIK